MKHGTDDKHINDPYLQVKSLCLQLGEFRLRNINLSCGQGEYHVLLGPTGSGKSSLMKAVLGFYRIDSGAVYLDGRDITFISPGERRMGYLPQNYSLFPHMKVEENIRFGLDIGRRPVSDADRVVDRLCGMLGIHGLLKRAVRNLSGGEKQKVALARALAIQPDILLLDEPFSSLDENAKRELWLDLKAVIKEIGITTFHITHNLEEAYSMGERLTVMLDGRIHQSTSRREMFERPATLAVARFLNYRNIFRGRVYACAGGSRIETDRFAVVVSEKLRPGTSVWVCVRNQDIKILKPGKPLKPQLRHNVLSGYITAIFPFPGYCIAYFKTEGGSHNHDLEIKLPSYLRERHGLYEGCRVSVAFWEPGIILFKNIATDGTNDTT